MVFFLKSIFSQVKKIYKIPGFKRQENKFLIRKHDNDLRRKKNHNLKKNRIVILYSNKKVRWESGHRVAWNSKWRSKQELFIFSAFLKCFLQKCIFSFVFWNILTCFLEKSVVSKIYRIAKTIHTSNLEGQSKKRQMFIDMK
jgi:hypothetical protein